MSVAGTYDFVTKTPMGDQQGKFTVNVERRHLHRQRHAARWARWTSTTARSTATR